MNRSETLQYIVETYSPEQCRETAAFLRANGYHRPAGVWFEAADIFERSHRSLVRSGRAGA